MGGWCIERGVIERKDLIFVWNVDVSTYGILLVWVTGWWFGIRDWVPLRIPVPESFLGIPNIQQKPTQTTNLPLKVKIFFSVDAQEKPKTCLRKYRFCAGGDRTFSERKHATNSKVADLSPIHLRKQSATDGTYGSKYGFRELFRGKLAL